MHVLTEKRKLPDKVVLALYYNFNFHLMLLLILYGKFQLKHNAKLSSPMPIPSRSSFNKNHNSIIREFVLIHAISSKNLVFILKQRSATKIHQE